MYLFEDLIGSLKLSFGMGIVLNVLVPFKGTVSILTPVLCTRIKAQGRFVGAETGFTFLKCHKKGGGSVLLQEKSNLIMFKFLSGSYHLSNKVPGTKV